MVNMRRLLSRITNRSLMRSIIQVALAVCILSPATIAAQHGGSGAAPSAVVAPKEASQYAFLIGDWDLTVKVPATSLAARIHGMPKIVGTWSARRALDGWGIVDDLRITDIAGNPNAMLHATRYFDRTTGKWVISALDVYRGRFTTATGELRNGEMQTASSGTDANGKPYMLRTRMFDVKANSFRYVQDRSEDGGRTWTEGTLTIEARRSGTKK